MFRKNSCNNFGVSMKPVYKKIFFFIATTVVFLNQSFAQFQYNEEFNNLFVVDSLIVYATSTSTPTLSYPSHIISTLYKTTNAGINWQKHSLKIADIINQLVFTARDTGYFSTYYSYKLFKTTNGGESWDSIYTFPYSISDIKLTDSKNLFITSEHSGKKILLRTSDGGKSWQTLSYGSNQFTGGKLCLINEIIMYSINSCCSFSKSLNGGKDWVLFSNGLPGVIISVGNAQFVDENNGFITGRGVNYLVGDNGNYYPIFAHTSNGGMNWDFKYIFGAGGTGITDLHFANSKKGWLLANNKIYYTENKFTSKDSTDLNIHSFAFLNDSRSWGTANKSIYKTLDGWRSFQNVFNLTTNIDVSKSIIPTSYSLSQNYPNPFNPETTINYSLPKSEHVTLKVFDMLGCEVATLVDEFKQAGTYNYKFSIINHKLSSGIYFYRLTAGSYSATKKFILMK